MSPTLDTLRKHRSGIDMDRITIWRVKARDSSDMRREFLFHEKSEYERFVNAPKPGCIITDIIECPTIDAETALDWLLNPEGD